MTSNAICTRVTKFLKNIDMCASQILEEGEHTAGSEKPYKACYVYIN